MAKKRSDIPLKIPFSGQNGKIFGKNIKNVCK
jgi:hypothetical protein